MNDPEAPSDLEMELRRNLTPCICGHTFMQHDDEARLNCLSCAVCRKFQENYA